MEGSRIRVRRAGPLNRATSQESSGFKSQAFRWFLTTGNRKERTIWPDGETDIIPRFERGGPGSNPGWATEDDRHGGRGVAVSACLAVNQEVRVRPSSATL